jgi:hypothetical protein
MNLKKLCCGQWSTDAEFFSVEVDRFFAAIFRNSRQRPCGRRWDFGDSVGSVSP